MIEDSVAPRAERLVYTLFFSRLCDLSDAHLAEYEASNAALREKAELEQDGFVGMKTFVAEDGERLTVVRFRDQGSQGAWRRVPAHVEAQRRGREWYYEEYRIVVCEEVRSYEFVRADGTSE